MKSSSYNKIVRNRRKFSQLQLNSCRRKVDIGGRDLCVHFMTSLVEVN